MSDSNYFKSEFSRYMSDLIKEGSLLFPHERHRNLYERFVHLNERLEQPF